MEKRAFERIPANLKVEFFCRDEITYGTIANLSKNGMLVNTKVCFPLHSKFEILLPSSKEVLNIPVRVSRVVKAGDFYDGMGVELLNPPQSYLKFVDSLGRGQIKSLKKQAQTIKTYVCKICRHIAFDYLPIGCPVCRAPIENFDDKPEAVKTLEDFEHLGEFEKKHFPFIHIPKEDSLIRDYQHIDVHVKVGEIAHRMEKEDHITFIDFYFNTFSLNKRFIARVSLNYHIMFPAVTLRFNKATSGILTVIDNCNAHGSWMSETKF